MTRDGLFHLKPQPISQKHAGGYQSGEPKLLKRPIEKWTFFMETAVFLPFLLVLFIIE
jgi:hypothetical protein